MSTRDKQRLELCDAFLSIKPQKRQAHDSRPETRRIEILYTIQRQAVEVEKKGLVQKLRLRDSDTDVVTNTAWRIRDAVDAFIQYNFMDRFNADNQKALDEVLTTMFADKDARKTFINGLIDAPSVGCSNNDGCIFVAAVEGHPSGIERFVGRCQFEGSLDHAMHTLEIDGIEKGSNVRLLPMSEIVLQERTHNTLLLWAYNERREQVYRHGIDRVHHGFTSRECMFVDVCRQKDLCRRCGGMGHRERACCAVNKAAWAGGAALDG